MTRVERLVVDTYAWIELFTGGPRATLVKSLLVDAEELYTPDIVLAELARKYMREDIDAKIVRERLKAVERLSTVVMIDVETAVLVGRAYRRLLDNAKRLGLKAKPSLADAIILAAAWRLKAKVLTGDMHFKNLEETIWIGE
ncbi:PilT protein domain protein [Pyrolobus fumarii 1A]|uniref:Ribonuclease VapC n=1 Tax=Pyrolobus fumarii (strain DSM 11204 / 1A) TaxID=694429 RepID=G0ECZ2_PYRF1|nr:PIN domain-containing protein [Pyrolobus fumarii]AEM39712.1 PilT protein domain protein [Pyrolobus fumarii 1A]